MNPLIIAKTLKAKGQPMTLTRSTGGILDPVTGLTAGATNTAYVVNGITSNYNSIAKLSSQSDPNSLIQSGDKKAIISAGVVEPLPGDTLTIMGKVWTVIAVDTLCPQGVNLMHTCQVRL